MNRFLYILALLVGALLLTGGLWAQIDNKDLTNLRPVSSTEGLWWAQIDNNKDLN